MATPLGILDSSAPVVHPAHVDDLWFPVAGTLCNIRCRSCFIGHAWLMREASLPEEFIETTLTG
ncbi:MAG TPA: hypothetical protein VKU02_19455 [Gemmataceae bacterium]|nr:hypothetical protein [Gemmataceae bacterium]